MTKRQLFQDAIFLIICGEDASGDEAQYTATIERLIVANGGTHFTTSPSQSLHSINKNNINHVVTSSLNFADYTVALDLLIPITTGQWVIDSERENQRKNYRLYPPSPQPPMAGIVLCIANNLPHGDKDVMYTAARLFGGQYLDLLSRYTTHLLAVDRVNSKAVIAVHVKRKQNLDIKLVLPEWFAACILQQRHVPEEPYLLSDPIVCETGRPNFRSSGDSETIDEVSAVDSSVLQGKRIFFCLDFNLSKTLVDTLEKLVLAHGAVIVTEFQENDVDVFIGKYRNSDHFFRACSCSTIRVALLLWLFHTISTGRYDDPLASNMLYFPVPKTGIPQFLNLRISVTGINGDARHYLVTLITAMGAEFTKTLDSNNHFLVCGAASSEKIDAVNSKWSTIKLVNSLWLEECFAHWKFLDPSNVKYSDLINSSRFLGRVHISRDIISSCVDRVSDVLGIDDSAEEHSEADIAVVVDETSNAESHATDSIAETVVESAVEVTSSTKTSDPVQNNDQPIDLVNVENSNQKSDSTLLKETKNTNFSDDGDLAIASEQASSQGFARASRSAKQKASLKLHSDMEDLNKYLSISKSSRKMKDYMAQLELSVAKTPTKKHPSVKESTTPKTTESKGSTPVAKKKQKVENPARYVVIMTGCEQFLTPSRADVVKLSKVGISLVNDYDASKRPIDTIVAPKVLRTEKFLKSLSQAVRIVHPTYLTSILAFLESKGNQVSEDEVHRSIDISDYSLDKVVSVALVNEELGYEGDGNGLTHLLTTNRHKKIMSDLKINLSTNLNGGAHLIESILKAHGLTESRIVKLSSNTSAKDLVSLPSGDILLVSNKKKDLRCNPKGVTVLDWNWCVKCLFTREIVPYE